MYKKLPYLLLALSLSAPVFASDWASSTRGLELTQASDAKVIAKTEILTAYGLNYWLYQMPLQVSVDKNTATVMGNVQNPLQKNLAIEIAKSAQGIKNVIDKIRIDESLENKVGQVKFIQKVRDLNTTGKIIEKIAKSNPFYGRITVISYQGQVTLTGTVQNKNQKEQAERIAAHTMGVESVTNQLAIEP